MVKCVHEITKFSERFAVRVGRIPFGKLDLPISGARAKYFSFRSRT